MKKPIPPYSHLVLTPYPKQFEQVFKLADGREVLLRPMRPEDEPMEAEMFTHFSPQTQRFRVFQRIKNITHEMLVRFTQIDYSREMAIIAEIEEEGIKKMARVVRIIAEPFNESAEFAIVVADPWPNQGLGNKFTDYILEVAREMGLRKIYANFLKENFIMRHLFEKRNFTIMINEGEEYYSAALELN